MDHKWNISLNHINRELVTRFLVPIVGPSGSGKTTLAAMLQDQYKDIIIPTIYTTRPRRADDLFGHYRYVSCQEFSDLEQTGSLFLSRISPYPQYGWDLGEVRSAVVAKKFVLFLFRHGGIEALAEIFPNKLSVIFIDPHEVEASKRSANRIKAYGETTLSTLLENRRVKEKLRLRNWKILNLKNMFDGIMEVEKNAETAIDWMRNY